jgi:DNA polymerase III subunit gamma/tau
MGKALYRTYRSKSFDEVVGQEHITSTLAKAVKNGRISHAYLFTGPRGVGKTSVARILAHDVNNLPYTGEETHLDIIEIDAASNRRIDEIRELRDKVHVSPSSAKYKVYIIDEVHMLTREAFNALLKTLEEPPAHTLFILATTEAHKLPETIVSRTQRFNFHSVPAGQIADHLSKIARREKISIDEEALQLLAEYGEGSFRDSISLLDQLAGSGGRITAATVRRHLALPANGVILGLLKSINDNDAAAVLETLEETKNTGTDPVTLSKFLAAELRRQMLSGQTNSYTLKLLRDLLEVPASPMPEETMEIAILEALSQSVSGQPKNEARSSPKSKKTKLPAPQSQNNSFSLESWSEILENIRNESQSLYSALRLAVPKFDGNNLNLFFEFDLHKNKAAQAKHTDLIGRVIEDLTSQKISLNFKVDKAIFASRDIDLYKPGRGREVDGSHLQTINSIFGAAEMLES